MDFTCLASGFDGLLGYVHDVFFAYSPSEGGWARLCRMQAVRRICSLGVNADFPGGHEEHDRLPSGAGSRESLGQLTTKLNLVIDSQDC